MNIEELIRKLEEMKEKYGNVSVVSRGGYSEGVYVVKWDKEEGYLVLE